MISGNGGLTTAGANTLILTSNEAYTGATNILAGTLALSGPALISASSGVTVASGATFDISGVEIATVEPRFAVSLLASTVVSSLSGAGTTILGGNQLVIDLNNTSSTYSGVIQDGGGIVSGTGQPAGDRKRDTDALRRQHLYRQHHSRLRDAGVGRHGIDC